MPPRTTQPKIYLLQVKTHKLSIHLTVLPTTTLADLKQEVFDALTSDVAEPLTRPPGGARDDDAMDEDFNQLNNFSHDTGLPRTADDVVPRVTKLEDFELCYAVKDKNKMTGEFRVLEANDMDLKTSGLTGWETLFVQFRDKKSGLLTPAKFTLPPIDDEEEEAPPSVAEADVSSAGLGKRKARED